MFCLGLTQLRTNSCFSLVHPEALIASVFIQPWVAAPPATCTTVTNARAGRAVSHDKVPSTLSSDPVSESSSRLLLIDERLRNGVSTGQWG